MDPARIPRARATAGTVIACSRVTVTTEGTSPGNPHAEDNPEYGMSANVAARTLMPGVNGSSLVMRNAFKNPMIPCLTFILSNANNETI
jgi:hypothetical protein